MAVTGVINGREYVLDDAEALRRLSALEPEPVRDHYVVVRGRRMPPKQALAALLGLDRADFTTYQARTILRRLGFETGRRRGEPEPVLGVAVADGVIEVRQVPSRGRPGLAARAEALRPYVGMWVAVRDDEVVESGASPQVVITALRRAGAVADSLFRVPLDPTRDVIGG